MMASTSKSILTATNPFSNSSNSNLIPTLVARRRISRGYATAATTPSANPSSSKSTSTSSESSSSSAPPPLSLSSCPPGTTLTGLSILKDRPDPISLPDNQYPKWLWEIASTSSSSSSASDPTGLGSTTQTKGEMRMALKRAAKIKRQEETKLEKNRKRLSQGNKKTSSGSNSKGVEKLEENDKKDDEGLQDVRTLKEKVEDEKRKGLRKANKDSIKAKNFLKSS